MSRRPEQADEPNKLLPNRAPSSSAQSTTRTVTGGLPWYCALIRRSTSTPASVPRQPSSHPPLGTESMWPPMSNSFSLSPRRVAQRFPAASSCISTGSPSKRLRKKSRAATHTGVKATRCAPSASPVNARNSLSSYIVRSGESALLMPQMCKESLYRTTEN